VCGVVVVVCVCVVQHLTTPMETNALSKTFGKQTSVFDVAFHIVGGYKYYTPLILQVQEKFIKF